MEPIKYFRQAINAWCPTCNTEVGNISICHSCGNTYMYGTLDPFTVIECHWVTHPTKWWNPATWEGGKWVPLYKLNEKEKPNEILH